MVPFYKFPYFTGVISYSFAHQQNNLPFNSTAGQGTQKCFCFHQKVHSIPHSAGNFPKDAISSPSLSFSNTHWFRQHTHAHTLYMRACMLMCFIYLSAEQTTCCVSLVSCVMMMKGTCCSQQKPLSTLCYWHPACIIHKSSGNSVTSQRLSTFVTWAERKCRRGWVYPCPYVTFCKEKMRQQRGWLCSHFMFTL